MAKVDATRNYGAQVELVGAGFDESMAAAQALVDSTGATFVHAFEDERVIAGQGTIGLELVEQLPDVGTRDRPDRRRRARGRDRDRAPCAQAGRADHRRSGGEHLPVRGRHRAPATRSPRGSRSSSRARSPPRSSSELLDEVVTVTDEQISHAIVLLLERTKLLVEGAGAASVAALLAGKVPGDDEVCAILSGGNIDPTLLIQVMRHGLTQAGRFLVVRTRFATGRASWSSCCSSSRRSARTSSRSSITARGWSCRSARPRSS